MKKNGKIYPENSFQLVYTYSGNQKLTDEFYEKIYSFEKYLHVLYNDCINLSDDKIQEYFEKNASSIRLKMGITNFEDFNKTIELVKEFFSSSIEFEKAIFNIDQKRVEGQFTVCPITFQYINGNELQFNLFIANDNSVKPLLQFLPK